MRDYSYQLYSSRNFGPLPETLRLVAGLGYTQVEGFGGLYPDVDAAAKLEAELAATGLKMPTGHFGFDMVSETPDLAIEIAGILDVEAIIVPFLPPEARPSDWAAFGKQLAEAGKPIRDAGLAFGWHNHDFEFAPTASGELPLDQLLAGGEEIGLELDLGWVARAGHAPADWATKYADRILAVHLKDVAPDGDCLDEGGWADLGHGVIDWAPVIAAVDASAARFRIMEHDNPSDDARFARRSIATAQAF
ncbi:sugar phosphate isomerase/epimerase [Tropicimonas sp. TH_r6]|uniref:sugar phosphate isomerase/epimerase family protein n=1 Tax=Tropicimonas sp. TH_r6 TaxID=3082085 RepID=UPI002953D2F0|nr:sugar phosphate isomerase/epimerase [Tropicimonas sp. TH_r6]MDV7142163.1 sugar phosphate isomerase/epimerase [Tropicimonas sp. TH_r6]